MRQDATNLVRRCKNCQYNSKLSKIPPYERISITGAWPFDLWGIDIVGPFSKTVQQYRWIIVAVEYFTKWVEAEPIATINSEATEKFIWKNIICRFGVPHALVSDNGTNFNSDRTTNFLNKLGVRNNFTSVSHPASNGLAEVTNRTILEGLKKKMKENKNNWSIMLEEVLWAYQTTPREATQRSPYSLVYGMEAMTPLEFIDPSLRRTTYEWEPNADAKNTELELIDEAREEARTNMERYQRRIKKAFDTKVVPRSFQEGDLVLRRIQEGTGKHVPKLGRTWEGPYRVKKAYGNGAHKLEYLGATR